jgi:hypothetical protein
VAGCRASGADEPAERRPEASRLVEHGRFAEALEAAQQAAAERPEDPQAQEDYRLASVACVLEQVRRLSFEGQPARALAELDQAEAIGADVPQVRQWSTLLRTQLAREHLEQGLQFLGQDDLSSASQHFERALQYTPGDPQIEAALANVLLQKSYRQGEGEKYYQQGLQALNDYWLEQARHDFASTVKFDPAAAHAQLRGAETRKLLGAQRAAIAAELESQGLWSASRNEYRLALLLDPDHAMAKEGLARTTVEEASSELLREAERLAARGEFEAARAKAQEGLAKTQLQREAFEAAVGKLEETGLEIVYQRALTFEKAQQYPEAIAIYAQILDKTPFFKDAISRRDTLESYVREAGELYDKALASAEPAEQLALLRRIAVFWEGYKDVRARIAALQQPSGP